jgi:hypothetical protein
MDMKNAYEWGKIFASPWSELTARMGERASIMGFTQKVDNEGILWAGVDGPEIKFCFINEPSDIDAVRRIFNDDENASIPTCFIVVKQPDPSETRGDVIFDIFRMNRDSYLWHFNRVYTPPK